MTEDIQHGKYKDGVNQNARLIVRNLPWKATEEALRKYFEAHGSVEEVKLLRRPDGKLVGCGFVHFKHVPMANKALVATNKKKFMGRPISVNWAVAKDKYIQKKDQQRNEMVDHVKEEEDDNDEEKPDVKEELSAEIKSKPGVQAKKEQARLNRNARLIIRNVSFKATEESLKEHFQPYGDIHEVKLLKKPDGKLVGCAFVHYKNVPMAREALLHTNLKPFLGRPISVDWAVAKDKYMQHMDQQRLEMADHVKKEEDDDDEEKPDVKEELKSEIKSESESSDEEKSEGSDEEDDTDDEEVDDNDDDNNSQTSNMQAKKRIQLNDAEDGRTVFVSNLSFDVDDDRLKTFAEKTGPVEYALVCVDRLTEHSRGTAFVKFKNAEDASRFLSLTPVDLMLQGQAMTPRPALTRAHVSKDKKKQPKDSRNLYLVKEGVIVAGTKAAVGVSASDMAKRLALERSKTQMLKNLNRFVSRYRLVVSNLPPACDDARLRRLCSQDGAVTEARVMRDLRAPVRPDGKHPSKGFGFVMFQRTEDAIKCLRRLNNSPDVFDKNNRPIVSFSIEDRTALNARKKRLEKSIANNPLAHTGEKRKGQQDDSNESQPKKAKRDRSRSTVRKNKKFQTEKKEYIPGQFVRIHENGNVPEFTGLTSKEGGKHHMRTNHKLKAQADTHRQNVKLEKKKSKRALKLKMASKERIKLPKMKINKKGKKNKFSV